MYSLIALALGAEAHRSGLVWKVRQKLAWDEWRTLPRRLLPLDGKCEKLVIDIKHENWQKLAYWRSLALGNYTLHGIDHDYVSAEIRHNGKTIPVKVRLRGGTASEHFAGDRWSLRVRVRGDRAILGMTEFSLMDPQRRGFLKEWVLREALRTEGVISKRYGFVEVSINGRNKGVYAIDEHYGKTMLEASRRREGPVFRFLDDSLWAEKAAWQKAPSEWDDYYFSADIDVVGSLKGNEALAEEFDVARSRLEAFRHGDLPTHKVFDCEKMAKWMAVSDVLGAWHGFVVFSMKFYWNPITQLIEPIPDDGFTEDSGHPQGPVLRLNDSYITGAFLKQMFNDVVLTELYIRELERVSQKSYMKNLLHRLKADLETHERMLSWQYPRYAFDEDLLYRNQAAIRSALHPHRGLVAHFKERNENDLVLSIAAAKGIPVEVKNVSFGDRVVLRTKGGRTIIQGKERGKPLAYQEYAFAIPEGVGPIQENEQFNVTYNLLGSSSTRSAPVSARLCYTKELCRDVMATTGTLPEFPFLNTDVSAHTMQIKKGAWEVRRDLIIPGGYTVKCQSGTTIDLLDGATVVSHSPIAFGGTEESPITVRSSDSSGQGLVVLNADRKSVLEHVVFDNLCAPSRKGWTLTGAVTFYESPVSISNCSFQNSRSEDSLNIVRSAFSIKHSQFMASMGDALDCDFTEGTLHRVAFLKSGNDAADFSGSSVNLHDCRFDGVQDKAISVGEASEITADLCDVKDARIAVATKDMSLLRATDLNASDCEVGLAVYQKKPEYGPSEFLGERIRLAEVKTHYLIEKGSSVEVNGRKIGGDQRNVYSRVYGHE